MIGLKVLARSMDTPTSSGCCAYSWWVTKYAFSKVVVYHNFFFILATLSVSWQYKTYEFSPWLLIWTKFLYIVWGVWLLWWCISYMGESSDILRFLAEGSSKLLILSDDNALSNSCNCFFYSWKYLGLLLFSRTTKIKYLIQGHRL
jgi:hypothetical protein